ncbi:MULTISPECIES: genetic competence negative regulator [Oceanobacillus]|uniref:Adapter protein MecA n=1 Tax=Oceanobacillus kimchii TaxID=746691 RepID=A0ABQ5TJI5_9BACI|nr:MULTISPECIES: genetic competence negative regulator [Oceanobacillus]MBT2598437.1 genetic competence negative regulator [Oceanobacillus sp. ISL-74]MBT2651355.1 genetic competence negative regulator [Oceanobacillus sp. ISL-73]OEH55751.1 adapter protein mecA [Oceanobacillus sp. E9]GLO66466.1 adapter protein MecA 2 [Oceanobacillus kimchii]
MRIERVSTDQFKIFLTFDDLIERGFTREDLWHDASNVRSLFSDMMYEASSELGIELEGMLLVQVHLMQAQGMHIFVTQQYEDNNEDEDYIEMKVTLDESKELIFSFIDFEDIISVISYLDPMGLENIRLYHMDDRYYMILDHIELSLVDKEDIIGVMSEYANPSIVTSHRIEEYGKLIMKENTVQQIKRFFY